MQRIREKLHQTVQKVFLKDAGKTNDPAEEAHGTPLSIRAVISPLSVQELKARRVTRQSDELWHLLPVARNHVNIYVFMNHAKNLAGQQR